MNITGPITFQTHIWPMFWHKIRFANRAFYGVFGGFKVALNPLKPTKLAPKHKKSAFL